MVTKKTPQIKPAGPADKGLQVQSRSPAGFRRAGREWGPDPVKVPLSELTDDQVQALRDEPGLLVVDVDMPAAEEPAV